MESWWSWICTSDIASVDIFRIYVPLGRQYLPYSDFDHVISASSRLHSRQTDPTGSGMDINAAVVDPHSHGASTYPRFRSVLHRGELCRSEWAVVYRT